MEVVEGSRCALHAHQTTAGNGVGPYHGNGTKSSTPTGRRGTDSHVGRKKFSPGTRVRVCVLTRGWKGEGVRREKYKALVIEESPATLLLDFHFVLGYRPPPLKPPASCPLPPAPCNPQSTRVVVFSLAIFLHISSLCLGTYAHRNDRDTSSNPPCIGLHGSTRVYTGVSADLYRCVSI